MITGPSLEQRAAQPFVAIASKVPMSALPTVIPQSIGAVAAWLAERNIPSAGAPFIRYVVIDMADKMQIEIGFPVREPIAGDGQVVAGVFPAGTYGVLVYTGDYAQLMAANATLLDWGVAEGLNWDMATTPEGDAFAARYETYFNGPDTEPDPAKWKTEVAIKIRG